jgi:tRNA (guanine37-N1)-methyltransferase
MRFDVLTLFPEIFQGYFTQSILKLALDAGLVEIHLWNIRDWAKGKHKSVDDRPFGGGPGMVIMPEPVFAAVEAVQAKGAQPGQLILLTPGGERLTQSIVKELAEQKRLLLLCGRYEGFDERIRRGLKPRELSIGDFICNGGEVPAMVVVDTVVRYVPGVLGDENSVVEESHSVPGRLEYPQYTRPRVFRDMAVPEILLSGDHEAIARWRRERSRETGQAFPPDHNDTREKDRRAAKPDLQGENHEE